MELWKPLLFVCPFLAVVPSGTSQAQDFTAPLQIPPLASGTQFLLTPHMAAHDFSETLQNVMTLGYDVQVDGGPAQSMSYLGPTLEWQRGDSIFMSVHNPLMHGTTVHWHGMHIPAMMDGGPHQEIMPMTTWEPFFKVMDKPSTMWYHPHLHHMTYQQVSLGLAGLLRITDPADTLLPFHYGIDDIPLVVQDKKFNFDTMMMNFYIDTTFIDSHDSDYTAVPGFFGNTMLVNGWVKPVVTAPHQMVRYRILNGAQGRSFYLGLTAGIDTVGPAVPFLVTAADAGALDSAYARTRLLVNPGERWEIVVDHGASAIGDTLTLWTYAAEMPEGIVGAPNSGPHELVGRNVALMRVLVGPTTTSTFPKTSIPEFLGPLEMISGPADRSRTKFFYGVFPHHPSIDSIPFDMEVMNDTVLLNSTEEWTLINHSDVGHPFHIHDVHFFITGSNSPLFNDPIYKGPKDVVIVPAGDTLTFITEFLDFADSLHPYMYHCHILAHEDQGMMHQWIVVDPSWHFGLNENGGMPDWSLFPNPTDGTLLVETHAEVASSIMVSDATGRTCSTQRLPAAAGRTEIDLSALAPGLYIVKWQVNDRFRSARVVRR